MKFKTTSQVPCVAQDILGIHLSWILLVYVTNHFNMTRCCENAEHGSFDIAVWKNIFKKMMEERKRSWNGEADEFEPPTYDRFSTVIVILERE